MRVARRVVHYLVAVVGQRFDGLRVFIHPVADKEERGVYLVLIQNVDKLLGVLVAPCGVEGQRDDLVAALHAVYRQLARRGGSADYRGIVHRPEYKHDRQRQSRAG